MYGLGLGSERSSLLFLISMDDRSFDLDAYGLARGAFDGDSRRDELKDAFRYDFGKDDWYSGIVHYIDKVYDILDTDRSNGVDYEQVLITRQNDGIRMNVIIVVGIALIVALIIAGAGLSAERKRMKNVQFASEADSYMGEKGVLFSEKNDIYKYSTTYTRTIETSRSGGGGGGGHSHSSGHF